MSTATRTPWIVSASFDSAFLLAPGFLALAAVVPVLAGWWPQNGDLSPWAWLLLVVGIDVAHVWSTLFRVYLDRNERTRRPLLYWGLPCAVFASSFVVHSASPSAFWTLLAYIAVHHFIKQQYGFVSLYRYRAGERRSWVRRLDQWAVYVGAGVPVLFWHATLPREIAWFVDGDFLFGFPSEYMPAAWTVYGLTAVIWLGHRSLDTARRGWQLGRDLTMIVTWLTWWVGIVVVDLDFVFTTTNVVLHGVPYAALVWHTSRRPGGGPSSTGLRPHVLFFVGLCLALALAEEWLWDLTVWSDHAAWFGTLPNGWRTNWLTDLAVPLLTVPQATHYLLDGFIWKLDGSNPGLQKRLFYP